MEAAAREEHLKTLAEQPALLLPPLPAAAFHAKPLALVEVAGRDSVAAAIKACQEREIAALLPTLVYNGAQCGPLQSVYDALKLMRDRASGTRVTDLVVFGSPELWNALVMRFADPLQERFGFFTPYVACHLYVHAVRVPLAKKLGSNLVISGERERHDGAIKINQTQAVLDRYVQLLAQFDIELWQPLRRTTTGAEIERLLGTPWSAGERQLRCALSGGYKNPDGTLDFGPGRRFSDEKSARFLDEYGVPLAQRILTKLLRAEKVNYEREAAALL